MSKDIIYREDAIKAIEELPNAYNGWSDAYDKTYIIGTLEEVPKADRPQGEWIDDDFVGQYRCSECDYYAIDEYDYCPNCGADMREREGE